MLESYETESDSCLNNYQDFDKKNYKDEKNYSLSVSYISNENIDRCWFFLVISYYVRLLLLIL